MYLKKTFSFLAAAVLTVSGLLQSVQIPASAETTVTTAQTEPQVQASATSQVGSILSNAINEDTIKKQSPEDYFIDSIAMSGNTATVRYSALIDCQLVIGVYVKYNSENYEKMIAIGTADVLKDEKTATVVIPDVVMPKNYLLKAYLIRNDGALLSEEYVESAYTEEIEALKASSISDYTDHYDVLNLDEDTTTNFAVFKSDVIVLDETPTANIIQTENTEEGKYKIQNLSKPLAKGKIVAIRRSAKDETPGHDALIFRVKETSENGSITTVTAVKDYDAADAFAFMKVEIAPKGSDYRFEPADGVHCDDSSPKPQQPAPGQAPPAQSAPGQKALFTDSVTFTVAELDLHLDSESELVDVSLSGSVNGHVDWEVGVNYYFTEIFTSSLLYYKISGEMSFSLEFQGAIYYPIGDVIIQPWENFKLVVGLFIKGQITASVEANTGFLLSSIEDNSFYIWDSQIGGSFFIGVVSRFDTQFGNSETERECGAGARITLSPSEPHQGCDEYCWEGDLSLIIFG